MREIAERMLGNPQEGLGLGGLGWGSLLVDGVDTCRVCGSVGNGPIRKACLKPSSCQSKPENPQIPALTI